MGILANRVRSIVISKGRNRVVKRKIVMFGLIVLVGLFSACGGERNDSSDAESPDTEGRPPARGGGPGEMGFSMDAEGFVEVSQLALGSLYLQGSENAITPEQAVTLLPLWEELRSLQERKRDYCGWSILRYSM